LLADFHMRLPCITPDAEAMARGLSQGHGLILAEALSFALTGRMPRPQAQARVKALCAEALLGGDLLALATRDFPGTDWHGDVQKGMLGQAPAEARDFASSVLGQHCGTQ
jgi:3-carboxy-cis,cis-muconate cycloisomerase